MKASSDSICAIATPSGSGGIGVVRACGSRALKAAQKFCLFLPAQPCSHKVYVGVLQDKGQNIDEVVLTYFKAGHSYTGDEGVEISCHGSDIILSRLIKMFLAEGLRLAEKGEFTYRAFLNQRIDLIQAESVLSLIESQSEPEALAAMQQLKGELSNQIQQVKKKIEFILAHIEASIDYSDIDIKVLSPARLAQELEEVLVGVQRLLNSYSKGQALKKGVDMVFVGPPNVGKSTLSNALVGYDRAIVSSEPGTTRDYIEFSFLVDGVRVTGYDTAGLRATTDEIEDKGLQKTYQLLGQAQVKAFVFDLSKALFKDQGQKQIRRSDFFDIKRDKKTLTHREREKFLDQFTVENQKMIQALLSRGLGPHRGRDLEAQVLVVGNKCDKKIWSIEALKLPAAIKTEVCALQTESVENLKQHLKAFIQQPKTESVVLLSLRQYEAMLQVDKKLKLAQSNLRCQEPYELVALDLREALQATLSLLGERLDNQIVDKIFSQFCIGK